MLTGAQYLESLNDGRVNYISGHSVDDIEREPLLREAANWVARVYDHFYSPGPDAVNPMVQPPRSADELREHVPLMGQVDFITSTTYQSIMTLLTAAAQVNRSYPELGRRIYEYVDDAKRRDIRIVECITDGKGNRKLPPSKQPDPDAYTQIGRAHV